MNHRAKVLGRSVILGVFLAACGDSPSTGSLRTGISAIEVKLDTGVVAVGAQAHATARVLDAAGNLMTSPIAWTSSNSAIASVSSDGTILGVAAGAVTITATVEGKGGSASLTVVAQGTAALAGTVQDTQGRSVGGGAIEVLAGTTQVALIPVSAAGTFSLTTLQPGAFTLRLHPPFTHSLGPNEPDVKPVTIVAGQSPNVGFTVQSALYADTFQSYASSSQLTSGTMAAGNFWAAPAHDMGAVVGASSITLDQAGGVNGDKAMRYDWPARPSAACSGAELTVGLMPRLNPPPTAMKDLWVRFTSKESPNFEHGRTGCGGRSYKFFLVQFESGSAGKQGRVGTYLGDASSTSMIPTRLWMDLSDNQGAYQQDGSLQIGGDQGWGGAYHTWVIEIRGIGTASATFRTYKDGQVVGTLTSPFLNGQTIGPGWAVTFEMGANINNGPDHAQSRWWREFGVYSTRPSLKPLVP